MLSQNSVSQKVCLRSGETSLGHDKEKTDFEVFLTYISSMFLFVFFEVESKREGTTVWLLHESLENERISQKKLLQLGKVENVSVGACRHPVPLPSYPAPHNDLEKCMQSWSCLSCPFGGRTIGLSPSTCHLLGRAVRMVSEMMWPSDSTLFPPQNDRRTYESVFWASMKACRVLKL